MQTNTLTLHRDNDSGDATVTLGEESIVWPTTAFDTTAYREGAQFPLFPEIDQFLKTLPLDTQAKIFDCYRRIKHILDHSHDPNVLIINIRPLIKELYSHIEFERLADWTQVSAKIIIPNSLATEYIDPNTKQPERITMNGDGARVPGTVSQLQAGTRVKTYLRSDYIRLVAYTIGLRLMFPIWGELLQRIDGAVGPRYKEFYCGKIIDTSWLAHCDVYDKLLAYVEATESDTTTPTMSGINSEDYGLWRLYNVLVRRLVIGDIRGLNSNETGSHLITFIHHYMQLRFSNHETGFAIKRIREKRPFRSNSMDDESRLSILESIKISEDLSPGDEAYFNEIANDVEMMHRVLCPTVPKRLISEALTASKALENERIHICQMRLLKNLIGPYMPPRSMGVLDKRGVLNALAVCQAMLWHSKAGYRDLAVLLTATELPRSDVMSIGSAISGSHIPRSMSQELMTLYPHVRRPGRSTDVSKRDSVVHELIRDTITLLHERDWRYNVHQNWVEGINPESLSGRTGEFTIPRDIRAQLARLFIRIGRHANPFHAGMDEVDFLHEM